MKYLDSKPFSVPVAASDSGNYERIFGHSGPLVVDSHKNPIKLSSYQKNEFYRRAKNLKEELRDILCTRKECWDPTDRNVNKMLNSEFKSKKKVEEFKNRMKAIGADPKDCNPERLRRR